MSRKQTRRSISVSGALYLRIKTHCGENGLSMSGFVESLARDFIGMEPRNSQVQVSAPAPASHKDRETNTDDSSSSKTVDTTELWPDRIAPADDHKHNSSAEDLKVTERRAGNIFTF
jgi:hypothetical protein